MVMIIFFFAIWQSHHMMMTTDAALMLTRDDCADLYSMIGANEQQQPENAIGMYSLNFYVVEICLLFFQLITLIIITI